MFMSHAVVKTNVLPMTRCILLSSDVDAHPDHITEQEASIPGQEARVLDSSRHKH